MKAKKPFRFKQFSVDDSQCSMKVGTDGVLLGAWAHIQNASTILDIGTGSGVIALMLAQRSDSNTLVEAVEIEAVNFSQATENLSLSPWSSQLKAYHSSIQDFKPGHQYDLIVTNPPFFVNSYLPPSKKRIAARHTQMLSHAELLTAVSKLLNPSGNFCLILPTAEGDAFQTLAIDFGLFVKRKTAFYSRKEKRQERWLLEFSFTKTLAIHDVLNLYDDFDRWSDAYWALTKEFYLDRPSF